MRVRFVNTYEPVVPLYRELFPRIEAMGHQPTALRAGARYRVGEQQSGSNEFAYIPGPLRNNKRAVAALYAAQTPFHLLLRAQALNVFLTQPPNLYPLFAGASRLRRCRYLIHIMDMYPELFFVDGADRWGLFRFLKRLAAKAYQGAEAVVVIGRCMQERVEDYGVSADRIRVIPNWSDPRLEPVGREDNPFLKEHDLAGRFVVMYSGNMGFAHDIATILGAAERLKDEQDIVFLFVGAGMRRREVEQAHQAGRGNIRLLDSQPIERLAQSLSAGHLHLISLRFGYEGLVVPSKYYGVLAVGRPVIYLGAPSGEVAQSIEEHGTGAVVGEADGEQLAEAIRGYFESTALVAEQGANARRAATEIYTPDESAGRYCDLIRSIL